MKYISKQKKKTACFSLSLSLPFSSTACFSLLSLSPRLLFDLHCHRVPPLHPGRRRQQPKKKKKANKLVTYSKSLENSTHIHFIHYICLSWQLHVILRLATIHVIFVWKSLINCIEKMQWLCIMKLFAQLINKGLYCKSEAIVGFFFFW